MGELDAVLWAVSDPARRAIIDRLAKGPARVTDVADEIPMSLAAVSKHMQVLERAGLVQRSRRGREHLPALRPNRCAAVAEWASRYERYWLGRLDRAEEFFRERRKRS